MRLRVAIGGHDVSYAIFVDSATMHQDSREAVSTCELSFLQVYGLSRYDVSRYNDSAYVYEFEVREWEELIVWDQDSTQLLFAGYIVSIQRKQEGPHVRYELDCSDWGILFERALITQSWPAGTPDSTVIADVLRVVPDIRPGVIVTQVGDLGALEFKDARVRDVLDQVCELTGSEWAVSYDAKLNYYRAGSIVAPFALSDQPDGFTSIGYQLDDYASDFSDAANRVLVLGGLTDTGEVRALAENGSSQADYGILSITLVDRNLTDQITADVWAQTEVQTRAFPKPTVKISLFTPGLARGMTVDLEAVKYGLGVSLILRSLDIVIAAPDRTRPVKAGHILKYSATLGWRPPDLIYSLRRMQRRPAQPTNPTPAPALAGSIEADDFAAGIAPVYIVSGRPGDWSKYPADAVFLNTADKKLYRRTGFDWTVAVNTSEIEGQLQTSQFAPGSITSTILADGSVVTAKIPAGAILAPQLAAAAVTANAIAANAITAQAIQANAVTAQAIAANAVTAGKIAALAVLAGNIAADAVTAGTIAAGAVVASAIAAGAVTAGKIAANAVTAGTIAAGAVTATSIQAGTIDSTKLNTTEIAVGYGGDKPGKIGVYNASAKVALVGDLSDAGKSAYGIWAKIGAFGGSGYTSAKVYTDDAGNVFIKDANLTITASDGSVIEASPATFDSTYSSIALNVRKPFDCQASVVSRGLVIRDSFSRVIGSMVRSPSNQVVLITLTSLAATTQTIQLDGGTGAVLAQSFGIIGQAAPFTGTVPAGRGLNVNSGLITGYI